MKMNLRNMINKLLDWEWKQKSKEVSGVVLDEINNQHGEIEKLKAANILVKKQIGQRAKTGDDAAEEFQGYFDSLGKELHDLENELKTLRLRTTAVESTSESRNTEMSGIRQQISLIKDRGAPAPYREREVVRGPVSKEEAPTPIPKKVPKVTPPPAKKLSVVDVVCEGVSRVIKDGDGVVRPFRVREIVMTLGDYKETSVNSQISGILKSIAWNNKKFYNYVKMRGLFPQRHSIKLDLSAKQIRNGWTKYERSMRKKSK